MPYKDRLLLPFTFDVKRLQVDLANLDQIEWIDHFVKQNYDGNWSAIALRMQAHAKDMHPIMSIYADPLCKDWIDSPFLKQSPYFQEVISCFQCPLEAVRIMRLAPGSIIKTHTDPETAFEEGCARIHIPIQTHDELYFYLNDERVIMCEGECWYCRFTDPHRVENRGKTDRVHIVIDARVDDWLRDLFMQAGISDAN